ncbi:hypothetical protein P153DRAFT_367077 [Dothidotthia symphoricarpi CBS 119687]|uniref:Uncharacterized protein n=1 Tax=Dothidotthia symphoricarpi CBS 119687 TaxID=1392245 RepID=A0A6A6AA72_9PLEO|nr:uncharacterized protein P153DRAFT_367077 [Dothidotthia symphoricarpi CBS 119687]KAF2128720.1 hypothetical protein P153DRAFT_367077 [Dothidotthia symphoricarpi CBS 119687]
MMNNIKNMLARRDEEDDGLTRTHLALLITLVVLFVLSSMLIGTLYFLRSTRRARKASELPTYEKRQSNPRRLTITTNKGLTSVMYSEKEILMSPSTPTSPVPEIRITFPDEVDESGKKHQGRVVVVRVGDHSVGLEPVQAAPPYSPEGDDRFDSLDLDRMGGLKEKDDKYYS